ncbi:MAG: DUF5693 family protein, partial [Elusimicrobiota bacterium]
DAALIEDAYQDAAPRFERTFSIRQKDFFSMSAQEITARYCRAVRERRIKRLLYWVDPQGDWIKDFAVLRQVSISLQGCNLILASAATPQAPTPGVSRHWQLWLLRILALTLTLAVCYLLKRNLPLPAYYLLCLSLGAAIWTLLQKDSFTTQSEPLRIVSAAFILPLLGRYLSITSDEPTRRVRLGALLGALAAMAAWLRLEGALPVSAWEHALRDSLVLNGLLRPRIMEVIGWFFCALCLDASRRSRKPAPAAMLLAVLGPIAAFNGFLHAHAPLETIIARSAEAFFAAVMLNAIWRNLGRLRSTEDYVLIISYAGKGNFGDDWLYERFQASLADDHRTAGLRSISLRDCLADPLKTLHVRRVIFIGGLLQDATSVRSFFYYWTLLATGALFYRGRVTHYSCGIGPLQNAFCRKALARLLFWESMTDVVWVPRDATSWKTLKTFASQTVTFPAPDSAFGDPRWHMPKHTQQRLGIAINARETVPRMMRDLIELAEDMAGHCQVVFFAADAKQDKKLAEKLSRAASASLCIYSGDTSSFIEKISRCQALISWRLHPAIAALDRGIPVGLWLTDTPAPCLRKFDGLYIPDAKAHITRFDEPHEARAWVETQMSITLLEKHENLGIPIL